MPAVQEEEEQEEGEEEEESAGCGEQKEVVRQRSVVMQEEKQLMEEEEEEEERSAGCGGQDLRRMRAVEGPARRAVARIHWCALLQRHARTAPAPAPRLTPGSPAEGAAAPPPVP